jgi:hypothetical protein
MQLARDAGGGLAKLRLARRERPRSRRAAEQRDELTAMDVDCHVTLPCGSCPRNGGTISRFERAVCDYLTLRVPCSGAE